MTRRPNKIKDRGSLHIVLEFLPHEFAFMKHNEPGPSGLLGGYQKMENWLVANTDKATLRVVLDPTRNVRLQNYLKNYGGGGPNNRMRKACIPAYRRLGIELVPEFAATKRTTTKGDPADGHAVP